MREETALVTSPDRLAQTREWVSERGWAQVVLLWAVSSLVILAAGWIGANVFADWRGIGPGINCCFKADPAHASQVQNLFARWDSGYYWVIARDGYSPDGPERAFFPLYPYLVRAASLMTGRDLFAAGMLISALSALASGLLLYQIAADWKGPRAGVLTALAYFCYPLAYLNLAFYPESLLLALSIGTVYYARKGNWISSGVLMLLAGAVRPVGWMLAVPYVIEFVIQKRFSIRRFAAAGTGLVLGAVGTLATLAFIIPFEHTSWQIWQPYLDFTSSQWLDYNSWPVANLIDNLRAIFFGTAIGSDWFARASSAFQLLFAVVAVATLVIAWRRLPLSVYAFLAVAVVLLLSRHGPYGYAFYDVPRRSFVIFPIFLALGPILYDRSRRAWLLTLAGSTGLLIFLAFWFGSGRWVS